MTSTEQGCGDAATAITFTSTSEQLLSPQPISPSSTPQMAATNLETPFNCLQDLSQLDDTTTLLIMNSAFSSWPSVVADSMTPDGNSNYMICPPSTLSYGDGQNWDLDYQPSEASYAPHFSLSQRHRQNNVMSRPRSVPFPDFVNTMNPVNDPQYSPNGYVNLNLVHPMPSTSMVPTSEPDVQIEGEFDSEVVDSIEPCMPVQQRSLPLHRPHLVDMGVKAHLMTPIDEDVDTGGEDMDGDKSEPYAKSLFRCLRNAPNHTMILRDIYDWFRNNTDKGSDPHERGWQNSIRHNLSMNKAFEKIEVQNGDDPTKRGYQWRLSEQALRDGRVQSTTRFRNKQPNKRGSKSHNPAPHRQASGARGGEMARRAGLVRRSERLRETRRSLDEMSNHLPWKGGRHTLDPRMHPSGPSVNALSGSPPRTYTGQDHFTSAPTTQSQSGHSSPYFTPDDNMMYAPNPQFETPNLMGGSPASFSNDSYPSTPEMGSGADMHFFPMGDRLFYDSSASTSEPRTPGAFSDAAHFDMGLDSGNPFLQEGMIH